MYIQISNTNKFEFLKSLINRLFAGVAELVDAPDSKSGSVF